MIIRDTSPSNLSKAAARWAAVLNTPRVAMFAIVFGFLFAILAARLWQKQVVESPFYTALADQNRFRLVSMPAARGIIYDRNRTPLVHNVPTFDVVVEPHLLPEEEREQRVVLNRLSVMLGLHRSSQSRSDPDLIEQIEASVADYPYAPVVVQRDIDHDVALLIQQEALALPGVHVEISPRREYLSSTLTAHILGYMGAIPDVEIDSYLADGYERTDQVGYTGVEASFERWLKGVRGRKYVQVDVIGRELGVIGQVDPPVPGSNIFLSIDQELQAYVTQALQAGIEATNGAARRGVVVVMNPTTGEILAMVSLPGYENNLFARGISQGQFERYNTDLRQPLVNHAISDYLPPGSIFKIVPSAAALQEGVITPYTMFTCEGRFVLPNRYFPDDPSLGQPFYCWNRGGHGALDVEGAIAHSCDIFFYKVGGGYEASDFEGLGLQRLTDYARLFGLGEPTGVELPYEAAGHLPSDEWKRYNYGEPWTTGDTYNLSIGQGYLLASPLQMLNATNVVANGGTLYRPQIVHHIEDGSGALLEPFQPEVIRTLPVDQQWWDLIRQGMVDAVNIGTSQRTQLPGVQVAGKTGTAEYCDDIAYEAGLCTTPGQTLPTHAWFTAFAPAENPEVSVIVFLYNGGEGSVTAVPIARDILEFYFTRNGTIAPAEEESQD